MLTQTDSLSQVVSDESHRENVPEYITADRLVNMFNRKLTVETDAEWQSIDETKVYKGVSITVRQGGYLMKQLSWEEHDGTTTGLILVKPHPGQTIDKPLSGISWKTGDITHKRNCDRTFILVCATNTTDIFTLKMTGPKSKLTWLFTFAAKDLQAVFGDEVWKAWLNGKPTETCYGIVDGTIEKKRRLTGVMTIKGNGTHTLCDISGLMTAGQNLEGFLKSVGISTTCKELSHKRDKGNMQVWFDDNLMELTDYGMGDTLGLIPAVRRKVDQINSIIKEALGFDIEFAPEFDCPKGREKMPMTSGSLVNRTALRWLQQHPIHGKALAELSANTRFATTVGTKYFKQAYETPRVTGNPGLWGGKPVDVYNESLPVDSIPKGARINGRWTKLDHFHPISAASIPSLVHTHKGGNGSGVLNALVQGGRCVNECSARALGQKAGRWLIRGVIDADLNSCYGGALASLTLPVGIPRVLSYKSHDLNRPTLREVLKRLKPELVDGCWKILISGKLKFDQDLIPSKINVNEAMIIKTVVGETYEDHRGENDDGRENDVAHLPGDLKYLTNEIIYGVITCDVLKVIHAMPANEKNAILDMTIDTAAYYAKSDEWKPGQPVLEFSWYAIPLKEFVGKFLKTRKVLKKLSKIKDDDQDLAQKALKLFINTLYGVLASPYFVLGNTITADNITARARVGAWMMAKALGSVQSITDGGAFSYDAVRFIDESKNGGRLPGLHTLSQYERMEKHRGVRVGQMTKLPFDRVKEMLHSGNGRYEKLWDKRVEFHVNRFWKHYDLALPFDIELKHEHTCDVMTIDNAADYLFTGTNPEKTKGYVFKSRGSKADGHTPHAKQRYLEALRDDDPSMFLENGRLKQVTSRIDKLIQVGEYLKSRDKWEALGVMPGDSRYTVQMLRPTEPIIYATAEAFNQGTAAKMKSKMRHDKVVAEKGLVGRQYGVPAKQAKLEDFPTAVLHRFPQLAKHRE